MRKLTILAALLFAAGVYAVAADEPAATQPAKPEWVDAMKELHKGFEGTEGYVAQFGDSITYSMAFWKCFSWADPDQYIPEDGLPKKPADKRWRDVIKGAGDEGKGDKAGNYSGWTVGNLLKAVPDVLKTAKPEAAIIMIGTNDARGNKLPEGYKAGLEKVVQMCLDAKCIPILSTIPPMRGCPDSVAKANEIIKALAAEKKLPLVDFHAAVMKYAPDGKWDGTLISGDGVHPSGDKANDFSAENLKASGYALRNFVSFMKLREVYFKVLHPEQAKKSE